MAYHGYIGYISFFLFFIYLFLEIESFNPAGRFGHSSVLVGNKLYFFGGFTDNGFCSNEVFDLDVSQPFNTASPPWNDHTAKEGMQIGICFATVWLSESNNEQSIYIFGGNTRDITTNQYSFKSLIYKLNLKSGQWEIPITKGNVPDRRKNINAVNDNSGKVYIFGGDNFYLPLPLKFFNDTVIFNIAESSWLISYQFNAPTPRSSYSATLLPNGVIVYIGGIAIIQNITVDLDISQINLYDTKSLTWSAQRANLKGQIDNRDGHTAILATNGKIIVHGGCKIIGNLLYAQVTPNIVVLNTETSPFEWTIPLLVSSNIGEVPSLTYHTANLVGNYMIVAFGNITQPNAEPLLLKNANVFIMDIRNYTWVNTLGPENIVEPTPSSTLVPATSTKPTNTSETDVNNQLTTMKVVIGTISGIVGAAILITVGIFGYKWYQRHQRDRIMRIYGNTT